MWFPFQCFFATMDWNFTFYLKVCFFKTTNHLWDWNEWKMSINRSASFSMKCTIIIIVLGFNWKILRGQVQSGNSVQFQLSGANALWPEIRLPQGQLRGRTFKTSTGKEYFAFLGIPYAVPPVGSLRFKVSFFFSLSLSLCHFFHSLALVPIMTPFTTSITNLSRSKNFPFLRAWID